MTTSTIQSTDRDRSAGLSPVQAIAAHCRTYCARWERGSGRGVTRYVGSCPLDDCPLHPYRQGRNPNRAGIGGRPRTAAWRTERK